MTDAARRVTRDPFLISTEILEEAERARAAWPPYNSAHEAYGVLAEEFRELEVHVFQKQALRNMAAMRREAIQVAAVALRFAAEVCDEEVGRR